MKNFKEILTEANKANKNLQRIAMANYVSPMGYPKSMTSVGPSQKEFDPITSQQIQDIDPLTAMRVQSQARQKFQSERPASDQNYKLIDLVGQQLEKNPNLAFNLTRLAQQKRKAYELEAKKYGYYKNPVQGGKPRVVTPQFTHQLMGMMGRSVQNRMGSLLPHHGSYTY